MKINKNQTHSFTQNSKAQGAIEYLLIIGAAIIVVAIVVILISDLVTTDQGAEVGLESGYTGLGDILDASQNRVTFKLSLKPGENTIEFSSIEQDNSLWAMFSSLPLGTTVEFTAVNDCLTGENPKSVNATKTSNAFMQDEQNANSCLVPTNGAIKITLPEDQEEEVEVDVKVEIDEEPFIYLTPSNFVSEIEANKEGNFKLTSKNYNISNQIDGFSGTLIGVTSTETNTISINLGTNNNCVFKNSQSATIQNITFYNNEATKIKTPICPN